MSVSYNSFPNIDLFPPVPRPSTRTSAQRKKTPFILADNVDSFHCHPVGTWSHSSVAAPPYRSTSKYYVLLYHVCRYYTAVIRTVLTATADSYRMCTIYFYGINTAAETRTVDVRHLLVCCVVVCCVVVWCGVV